MATRAPLVIVNGQPQQLQSGDVLPATALPAASTSAQGAIQISTDLPLVEGAASAGTSTQAAASDHVHPMAGSGISVGLAMAAVYIMG